MTKSPEYRTLVICADELKRLLRQQNHALEEVLNKFVCSSDPPIDSLEEESGGSTYLVNGMIEIVKHHPLKYHEFLTNLKCVSTLKPIFIWLSQIYCEFSNSSRNLSPPSLSLSSLPLSL